MQNRPHSKVKIISVFFFILSFLGICFVTTVNIFLFAHTAELPEQLIKIQAPKVLLNIFVLSLLFTIIASIIIYFTNTKPVKKILEFTNNVAKGNYKNKIPESHFAMDPYGYSAIKKNLNHMVEELNSVETLRTDFISNVSHELKTPLAVIQNYATILQSSNLSEDDKLNYLKQIINQITNLSTLITNILKLNKLENQKIYTNVSEINISELVCECMIVFEQSWEEKQLQIATEISEDIIIFTEPELLKLVINNLISNAIKFTEKGGKISIKVEGNNKNIAIISIKDTGCGMDSMTGNHIFEKFYQGETSHSGQGNGLGLALVKRIVDILGYEINVESEVGIGSTFTIICK